MSSTAGASGQFVCFNVTATDAYLALRNEEELYWKLYRMTPMANGFMLTYLGQHQYHRTLHSHAVRDAETRHNTI